MDILGGEERVQGYYLFNFQWVCLFYFLFPQEMSSQRSRGLIARLSLKKANNKKVKYLEVYMP